MDLLRRFSFFKGGNLSFQEDAVSLQGLREFAHGFVITVKLLEMLIFPLVVKNNNDIFIIRVKL